MEQKVLVLIWMKCVIRIPERFKGWPCLSRVYFTTILRKGWLCVFTVSVLVFDRRLRHAVNAKGSPSNLRTSTGGECQGFSLKSANVHWRWMPRVLPQIYKVHPEIHKDPPQNYVTKKSQGFSPKSKRRRFLYNSRSSVQNLPDSNIRGVRRKIYKAMKNTSLTTRVHTKEKCPSTCGEELSQKIWTKTSNSTADKTEPGLWRELFTRFNICGSVFQTRFLVSLAVP